MTHATNDSGGLYHWKDQADSASLDDGSSAAPGGAPLKKGPWTAAEDAILMEYVKKHGEGNWNAVQKHSGLSRCGKSCRLRWANHLRPNLKKGAFSPEEERLIIELHARIGNKWARMATQLPGRTDNEIKNYWNTRIKRRQRAGLPLYPADLNLQTANDNQQVQSVSEFGFAPGHHDLHAGGLEIPPVSFDGIEASQETLAYTAPFPDIPMSNILGQSLGFSHGYNFISPAIQCAKRLRGHDSPLPGFIGGTNCSYPYEPSFNQFQNDPFEKIQRPFSLSFPYDPDPNRRSASPLDSMMPGSHALVNGYFSASKPLGEVVKLELPSFQYPDTVLNNLGASHPPPAPLETVDSYIQSPPRMPLQSGCTSPRNSGLLQALIHEAQALNNSKNQSCDSSAHSSMMPGETVGHSIVHPCETEWPELSDSISPVGQSPASIFGESNPTARAPVVASTAADEIPGSSVKLKAVEGMSNLSMKNKQVAAEMDSTRPDLLPMWDWFEQSPECGKDPTTITDAIATLLGGDFSNDDKQLDADSSTSNQSWGLGSMPWNNMPGACQIPEQK